MGDYISLGHNWFGDEWPSLGLTEEEFLAEYSKTLDKLADTHTRWIPIFVSKILDKLADTHTRLMSVFVFAFVSKNP